MNLRKRFGFSAIRIGIWLLFVLSAAPAAFSQTQNFGGFSYTVPDGWTQTSQQNTLVLSSIDKSTGHFCLVTLYAVKPGSGNPKSDFTHEWSNVLKLFKAEANPKTEVGSADGWTVTAGAAVVTTEGSKSVAVLTVFSGFGKTASILSLFDDEAFAGQVDAFITGVKLKDVAPGRSAATGILPAAQIKFAGKWAKSTSGTGGRDQSGNVLNSSYYKLEYTFNGDGTYNFKAERWGGYIKSNEFWTTVENGTFTVAGDRLTITPAKSILTIRNRSGGVISSRNNRLESASYLWKIHYFAGINETELVLQTERETNRDGLFASNDDFPNSYLLSQSYKPDWRF